MQDKSIDVFGIGNAIIDIVVEVKEEFLKQIGVKKGSMTLISEDQREKILEKLEGYEKRFIAGGSCANTICAVVKAGGVGAFCGIVGEDSFGDMYIEDLKNYGVKIYCKRKRGTTGTCIVLITEDFDRTMLTTIGCASEIKEEDIPINVVKDSKFFYIEGYLWYNSTAAKECRKLIKELKKDTYIAFSASDYLCVKNFKQEFLELLDKDLDVFFANKEEAMVLMSKKKLETLLAALKEYRKCYIFLTDGENGSYCIKGSNTIYMPAKKVEVKDTTGAGDCYAGGVLLGLSKENNLKEVLCLGTDLASQIVRVYGGRL